MVRETRSRDAADLEGFEADLDRWGADVASWPRDARERGQTLLARSSLARTLLAQQTSLDRALLALRDHSVPDRLAADILSRVPAAEDAAAPDAPGDPWQRSLAWLTGALWRPVLAACGPLLLGFIVGAALPTTADRHAADQLSALASTEIYEELTHADP